MENNEFLIGSEETAEDTSANIVQPTSEPVPDQFVDNVTADLNTVETMVLSVEDYNHIAVSSIPIGALSGAIFMIIGFAFLGIVKIFKKV